VAAHGSHAGVLSECELIEGLAVPVLKWHFNEVDSTAIVSAQTGVTHELDELSFQKWARQTLMPVAVGLGS
jgi:hypothetical protein